jgi:hypothetical protein
VDYFCEGMADSFESVRRRAQDAAQGGAADRSQALRRLDPRQRRALGLFRDNDVITSRDVEKLFAVSQRTARNLLAAWAGSGFLTVVDPAKKTRRYALSGDFAGLR